MATYWLSFTLDSRTVGNQDYSARWDALYNDIRSISNNWWTDTTAFIVFETTQSLSQVVAVAKKAVSPTYDTVLIRTMDAKNATIFGPVTDEDIFKMMPYLARG